MPEQLLVPIKRLDETLEVPRYAYEGDAGVDLRAAEDFSLKPFERKLVPTGIAIALPRGYAGFVMPRSGLAVKHGISIVNTTHWTKPSAEIPDSEAAAFKASYFHGSCPKKPKSGLRTALRASPMKTQVNSLIFLRDKG